MNNLHMEIFKMRLAFLSTLLLSTYVSASHNCIGKVNSVDVSGSSSILANIGTLGDGNLLCYLDKNYGEFTPEACKAAYSLLLAAKLSLKDVRLWFRNDSNTSCSKGNWIDFSTHGVYHVRIEG
jgi:hypothetical protein